MRPASRLWISSCLILLIALCLVESAGAQVVDLGGGPAQPVRASLGDTLEFGIRVHTGGRRLTSAGLALQFDPAILQPVGTGFVYIPDPAFFPQAVIYENGVVAGGLPGLARARLVTVAGTAADGARAAMVGDGVLASIHFVVIGFADSAHIRIVTDGEDRPRFTELGRPGLQEGFGVGRPYRLSVALDQAGFLSLPDIAVAAGRVVAVSLRGRTATDPVHWSVNAREPELMAAWVQGDSMLLQVPPRRTGTSIIDYSAVDAAGVVVGSRENERQIRRHACSAAGSWCGRLRGFCQSAAVPRGFPCPRGGMACLGFVGGSGPAAPVGQNRRPITDPVGAAAMVGAWRHLPAPAVGSRPAGRTEGSARCRCRQ